MESKKLWQSKTLWLAGLQAIAGIVVALSIELPSVGWVAVVKSIIDVVLRLATNKPVI